YSIGLTSQLLCSPRFRTSSIRHVPQSLKFAVEQEYGLPPTHYGRTLEIDHIVSLELGGSNDVANLFPALLDAKPGYQAKDKPENAVAARVCSGSMTLRAAQRQIAADWQLLYVKVFGTPPI